MLNGCSYCVEHHFQGLRRLLRQRRPGERDEEAAGRRPLPAFDAKHCAALPYSELLTRDRRCG
ncbi:MAG: hypothetical protein ACMVO3_00075 [Thalassobaculum sp.]